MTRYTTEDHPTRFTTATREDDVRFMYRFQPLAVKTGIPRQTLQSAAEEGHLRCWYLADGLMVTNLAAVWEWQLKRKFKNPPLTR